MLLPDAQSAEGGKQLLSVSFSARLIAENDAYFFALRKAENDRDTIIIAQNAGKCNGRAAPAGNDLKFYPKELRIWKARFYGKFP